jgi:osmoprotectant transport system permease protein
MGAAMVERRRGRLAAFSAILLALYAHAVAALVNERGGASAPTIVVGAKTFTEQYILGELLARRLREAGADARVAASLGSTVAFDALRSGQIDVYVEYTGTVWATLMKRADVPRDRRSVLAEVTSYLRTTHGVELVAALGFENAYALAMRRDDARRHGVGTIGDLASRSRAMTIGGDYEFFSRPEWAALRARYGLAFAGQRTMDPSLMYQAAARGDVDVISAFTTDGRIDAFDLVVLEDDRGAIPPYDAVVLAAPRLAGARPEVVAALRTLSGTIDAATMRRLNAAVDQEGKAPGDVAEEFLAALSDRPSAVSREP